MKALVSIAVAALILVSGLTASTASSTDSVNGPDPVVKQWPSWPHRVSCGLPFNPIKVFSRPARAEKNRGAPERALRRWLNSKRRLPWVKRHGWRLTARNRSQANFVQGRVTNDRERQMEGLSFAKERGGWKWRGSGGCVPRTLRRGLPAGEWNLYDLEAAPKPDARSVLIGVSELGCHGYAKSLPLMQKPEVRYTEDAVMVTVWFRPRRGSWTCPGTPAERYRLQLSEPLGDRQLYDAGTYPPRPIEAG